MKLSGEKTRIGSNTGQIQAPKEASLVQIYGPNLGERYIIDQPQLTIGRDAGNDIVLDEDNVSRAHARFVQTEGRVEVIDLGSTNGTLVNDADVKKCQLRNGDIIKVGSVILKYIVGGNAEALYHEEIYRMTIQDGLTGVANRRYFEDFLERELARAVRYERPLSLAMYDIDHFKRINDQYGHLAGDYVLRRMAGKVKTTIRREELLARYGGEEFAIIMPETLESKAAKFAERIRKLVQQTPFEFDGQEIEVTISVGVASVGPETRNQQQLIHQADEALYDAKRSGRNMVKTLSPAG